MAATALTSSAARRPQAASPATHAPTRFLIMSVLRADSSPAPWTASVPSPRDRGIDAGGRHAGTAHAARATSARHHGLAVVITESSRHARVPSAIISVSSREVRRISMPSGGRMSSSFLQLPARARRVLATLAVVLAILPQGSTRADSTPQTLPFTQNWSNTGLITADDNWTGVPGIVGYRGDDITTSTGVDPQTLLADGTGTPVDVNANRSDPNTFTTGGVSEFDGIANPTVALQGSGTADAPFLIITLNTLGRSDVTVSYNIRDVDGSADNAIQPVALHYRVGSSGLFTNVPAAFVADATTGPSLATKVTSVSATLPASANNQPLVQIRIMTTNAVGSDEWVGIDDISITGTEVTTTRPSGDGSASPSTVAQGQASLLTVSVTPGSGPTSTGIQVSADLSSIGGAPAQSFANSGGNSFSFAATVDPGTPLGPKTLPVTISDA